jgi:hypothetical protein
LQASVPFRAGFVLGVRAGRGLPILPGLELQRTNNEADYNAGYSNGWHIAVQDQLPASGDQLLAVVEKAWQGYKRA